MVCKKCGRNVKGDFKFCPYCGERLVSDFHDHYNLLRSPAPFESFDLAATFAVFPPF